MFFRPRFAARSMVCGVTAAFWLSALATAQNTEPAPQEPDEVISYGTRNINQHEGMDAFMRGDFETAEIEFEQEFLNLKRRNSNLRSAVENAAIGANRAIDQAASTDASSASANGGGGVAPGPGGAALPSASVFVPTARPDGEEGTSILMDGKLTYQDFGFARYMSAMSEIKLGKLDEAEKSLKQSLGYDPQNYDARMRLGLLQLNAGDFEGAAEQLEALDTLRRKCVRKSCDELEYIREAALSLANYIMAEARH